MYKLAAIGNPIDHSLSPQLFLEFAQEFNLAISYEKILAQNNTDFTEKVTNFFVSGGTALSITSPFKALAYNIAQKSNYRSKFCDAANLLYLDQQKITADTTDGIGLITDVEQNNKQSFLFKNVLLLGSGYVIDSILPDIIQKNPKNISILSRNTERVNFLQNKYLTDEFDLKINYDIIINTTPNTADNELFSKIKQIDDNTFCYDLSYTLEDTLFLTTMRQLNPNVTVKNGLGMLREQAKQAFYYIFNKMPI